MQSLPSSPNFSLSSDTDLGACLALQRLPGLGAGRLLRLLEIFHQPRQILSQPPQRLAELMPEEARQALMDYQTRGADSALGQRVEQDLEWLARNPDVTPIALDHPGYPGLLKEIPRPPVLLYVRGNIECLELPQLAIVGSRTPSAGGRDNAFAFARDLASHGFAITSGLALGVDGAAHAGALAGGGKTLAVFGTGIDSVYPGRHKQLAEQILAEGGALISEFPLDTRSMATNFPQRNRLISGLSLGTLVVEAAPQSGSLITARLALQQNREVFAIPGSIHNPLARGCHSLIRQGATLVECAQDIVDQLGGLLTFKREQLAQPPKSLPDLDADEQQLIKALGHDPCPFDQLAERSGLDASRLAELLVTLELRGLISNTASGYEICL